VPTIRGIVGFVANALRCCHNLGVYHWDLSPNNVLVEFEESDPERVRALWLIDFNASKSSHVGGTTRAATECHAAPEQFPPYSSHRYTDYFLLGIIVYQMWVGKRPFHNFEAIKKGTFDPEPLGPPDSPVRQAVEALLNQDPDQRPRGLSLLLQALNVNPRDYDLPEPVYRRARLPSPDWGRRMALGSVALLALIGAMVVWTRGPQQDRPDLSLPTEAIVSASDVEAPPAGPETPEKDLLPPALPGPTEISARLQPPPQTMPTQRSGQIGRGADEPSRPQPTTRPLRRPSPPMRTKRRIPESPLPRQKVTPPEVTTLIRTIPPTPSEVTTPPSEVTTPPSEVTMPPSEVTAPPPKVTTTSPKVIAPPPKVTTTPPAREVSDEKTTELRSGESLP
jgi:serine/threonine protein kinase